MSQLLYPVYGTGANGNLDISANTTDVPIDASCSGNAESTILNANNDSFADNNLILAIQSRGANYYWEINKIASYNTGTITTAAPLSFTYINSGASQAQVIIIKEYISGSIASGKTLTGKAWNGDVGGIIPYFFTNTFTNYGNIDVSEKGFLGGVGSATDSGQSGEGSNAASSQVADTDGSGGGSGVSTSAASGGGGGNGTAGANSTSAAVAIGGIETGNAALTTMTFGGGGGGSNSNDGGTGGNGGNGGGIILIFANKFLNYGTIASNGGNATNQSPIDNYGGGGGAGGSIFIRSSNATLGNNLITANAGGAGVNGGVGGVGRIRVESCYAPTFATLPTSSNVIGGNSWCSNLVGFVG
jgi:hypothetical protein